MKLADTAPALPMTGPGPLSGDTAPAPSWEGLDEPRLVDTCEREPVYLLTGRNGSQIRLSASAHQLLRLRSSGITSEEIAEALSRSGKAVLAADLDASYSKLLERIEEIESRANDNPRGFWVRIRLLPKPLVVRLTDFLQAAFQPRVAAILLATVVAFLTALAIVRPAVPGDAAAFWLGYALLLASLVSHELGHASACACFGAKPSDIGATLYLIYPALYSDVSAAWRLPRRQRVVVDLGGLYFQHLVGAAYMAAYLLTGWQPLCVAILMILGSTVFSLNPIFKFDGYWVVADALGVTNLSQQPKRFLGRLGKLLRGRPAEPLPWPAGITATLTVYTVLSFAVWGYFLWRIGPRIWWISASLIPQIADFVADAPEVSFPSLLRSAFMAGLMLFISCRMVRSLLVAPAVSAVRRLLQRRSARRQVPETLGRAYELR